ncbi:hypothetical protein AB0M61_35830 [Streptomyces sp. NPDC051642]|uniref:hypothetical protein n=1 Tax=Streptomyces sp. NPDC051642 TaxID=3154646 RepID=UPI00341A891B
MIKSSAREGRAWKPSITDEEYQAKLIRESFGDLRAVAEATGQSMTALTVAIATRKTEEGSPWK